MNDISSTISEFFANVSISYLIGIAVIIIFLAKKLIKWAIIFAVLMFFVLPYLDEQGYLDSVKGFFS
ncbi:MAG: hypothetical protein ACO3GT_02055 [Candidatus Nanopelagicales bacterium]